MRVAHIITRLVIGGAQENTVLNCEDLIGDYGDTVLLITGPAIGPEGTLMERTGRDVSWKRSLEELGMPPDQFKDGAVPCSLVPSLQRAINPFREYSAYRQIKSVLRFFRPDVVHTHSAKAGILGRYAACSLGVPAIVHTVHGAPFYPWQNPITHWFYRQCERAAAARCDAFVSVADAMTELMVAGKVAPREKFTTIYSGMETETFLRSQTLRDATRRRFGFRDDQVVVGKVARLFHLKGHEYVIEAAREVVRQAPQVCFFFVGDGILREELSHKIEKAGLAEHFVFAGLIPPEEMPAMFSAMDIVVHTSLREGLARVLPQGLLCGKPVISYDVDGAREVVLDGLTGFLLPPKDTTQLAARIIELAVNPQLRAQFGNKGRSLFARQFDHHYMTEQIRKLYQNILETKKNNDDKTRFG